MRALSVILIVLSVVVLALNYKDIRLESIFDKVQPKAECIADKAPMLIPDTDLKGAWSDLSEKFRDFRGFSGISEKLDDAGDVFTEKLRQIETKKDTVIDYVN